ncbi:MAG: alpha/beta hydrolase fold domain-containing protein [Rhodobacteraceae bacterium]|nr:alpha/beta hydrolase fold domain-containing protein [Paracoccaceae bacterium]
MASDRSEAGRGASLNLAALNLALRLVVKPRLARTKEPVAARREFECAAWAVFRAPPYPLWLPGVVPGPAGGLVVSRISTGPVDRRRVILYLHGGAYVAGSPRTHRAMLARLSLLAGVPVLAPDYRLAPEHPFPAALEDAQAAWQHLYDAGYDPEHIVIGGDSAGGGLAFALLSRLCRAGTPPAAAFAFSPWADLAGGSPSVAGNARLDPLLPAGRMVEVAAMYLQGHPAEDPEASPVMAEFPAPAPVLLQHSQTEILRDDTLRLAARLRSFGGAVTVQDWPSAPHVWQVFDGWVPESRDALERAGAFIRAALRPEPPPPADS